MTSQQEAIASRIMWPSPFSVNLSDSCFAPDDDIEAESPEIFSEFSVEGLYSKAYNAVFNFLTTEFRILLVIDSSQAFAKS